MQKDLHIAINTRRPGTFARWARAKALFAKVCEHANAGRTVYFSTAYSSTPIKAKHIREGLIRCGKDGLYVQRGRRWDFLGGCKVTVV